MRADRDDIHFQAETRPNYALIAAAGAVLVIAALLYFGFRDDEEPAPVPVQQVVRDSAIVAPPVVDTPPQLQPAGTDSEVTRTGDFGERQLPPPVSTVGAGAAPLSESANGERFVIEGELLEELEAAAQTRESAPDAQ